MSSTFDVAVIGAGPAGSALAQALAQGGARVALVDPRIDEPWKPFYCCFERDVLPRHRPLIQRRWSTVRTHARRERRTASTYVRFDNERLKDSLRHPAVDLIRDRAEVDTNGVVLGNGRSLMADVVVDARGRRIHAGDAAQIACGEMLQGPHGLDPDEAIWMDFSPVDDGPALSFAYVLPHGPDRVFVEETSLAARPPVPRSLLARRLVARKASLGLNGRCVAEEDCAIALGGRLPAPRGRCLPYGAAAHFTHPATGFQLTRALSAAPSVAQALLTTGDPAIRVQRAWQAAWPAAARRSYALFDFGLETLLDFDAATSRDFFDGLFSLKPSQWQRYLQADARSREVLSVMSQVFLQVRPQLRLRLVQLGVAALADLGRF